MLQFLIQVSFKLMYPELPQNQPVFGM